jgi:hypothetical protein
MSYSNLRVTRSSHQKSSFFVTSLSQLSSVFLIIGLLVGSFSLIATKPVQAAGELNTKNPNYFYDRESAFIIKNALDTTNGGMYLAVDKDGSAITENINENVWGYGSGKVKGVDKTQVGQATCVRYFMNEYLRTKEKGVAGINELLPAGKKLTDATDVIKKAAFCADFALDKMVIPTGKQGETRIINGLYYWGVVSQDGTTTFDDTLEENTESTYRKESSLPWAMAELALMMKKNGVPGHEKYQQGALDWWNWRKDKAASLNDNFTTGIEAGAGRDMYYPAIGWALTQLTGLTEYRDGTNPSQLNNDGTPYGAIPFINDQVGTGSKPIIPFNEPEKTLQEKSYAATYGRGFMFAKHQNEFPNKPEDRDQWQDFGWHSLIRGDYPEYFVAAPTNITDAELAVPFEHTKGRELLSGLIRSSWFFGSYLTNPEMFYIQDNADSGSLSQGDFLNATKSFWDFTNSKLWDDTSGQQAWLEATGAPFKPCFSGDNDVPFVDWKGPKIGDKVHSLNTDRTASVTVSGVEDEDVPFMSIALLGSGVKNVEVTYSFDNGATWVTIPASFNGTNYTATIPAASPGVKVYYYAKAYDKFNNSTVFPAEVETSNTSNEILNRDKTRAQFYTIPGGSSPVDPVEVPGGNGGNNGGGTNGTPTTPVKPVETTPGAGGTNTTPTPTAQPIKKSDTGAGGDGTGSLIRTGGFGVSK